MKQKIEYLHRLVKSKNSQLEHISRQEGVRKDICPSIGQEIGHLLFLFIKMLHAKRVIEFGTCLGYSTIWLAQALEATNGELISIEASPRLVAETLENIQQAGLRHRVTLIHGKAEEILVAIPGPFDLILQDAAKDIYLPMLNICVDKLRPGGLLISDDVLFPALEVRKKQKELIHAYNEALLAHPALETVILPLGDGLAVSWKKENF